MYCRVCDTQHRRIQPLENIVVQLRLLYDSVGVAQDGIFSRRNLVGASHYAERVEPSRLDPLNERVNLLGALRHCSSVHGAVDTESAKHQKCATENEPARRSDHWA